MNNIGKEELLEYKILNLNDLSKDLDKNFDSIGFKIEEIKKNIGNESVELRGIKRRNY